MNFSNALDILIVIALLCLVLYRQFTWQLVTPSRVWRMPVILAAIGVVMIAQIKNLDRSSPLDFAIIAGEIVISLGLGTVMGFMARFRTRPQRASDVSGKNDSGHFDPNVAVIESRTGVAGAVLWVVLIALRVGIEILVTHYFPSALLASTGTILLVVAANRAARAFVMMQRLERAGIHKNGVTTHMMVS
jgi:hypothetical protein